MKNFFKRFSRNHQSDSARCRVLEQENARQRSRISELEHQLTLQKEVNRRLKDQLDDAPHFAAGIRQLDPQGIKYLFGSKAECREETGATILSGIAPFQGTGVVKTELAIPAGMHFEMLSQVIGLLQPQSYESLSKLVGTFAPDLASGTFLSCTLEEVKNDIGVITTRRLTPAPPERQCFVCVYESRIIELKLSVEEYLQRVVEYRGELGEDQIEAAGAFYDAAIEFICDEWHEAFSGVIFPNQPDEEVSLPIERTD